MISYPSLGSLGRLGNQLFQIASVIGIAKKNNTQASFPDWKYNEFFENKLPSGTSNNYKEKKERFFHLDEEMFALKGNCKIEGFLQSYKYWEGAEKEVRDQFKFKPDIVKKVTDLFPLKNTVAISIRRGDFVNNKYYYQVPLFFYLSAYYKYFPGCEIIIFSDDFKYCKLHFESVPNVRYAEGLTDIEQLCLMSMCSNFIISNSTFSWWGAYLSGSKDVIRPLKNFDESKPSEKDYWPEAWKPFEEKIDLKDTTFIIPVFYDHLDRRENIMLTVGFLLNNFNTNIIIGEQGGSEFEFMSDYVRYEKFDLKSFHRTKMINDLVRTSTEIIVNWDGDNICPPAQLLESVNLIRNGADIAYPFDGRVIRVPRYMFTDVIESMDVTDINTLKCLPKTFSSVGHALVMNKKSFIDAGMENEHFISWGPEDSERYDRFNMLGLSVKRVAGKMYHMDHFIGENSSTQHQYFSKNNDEFYKVKSMNKKSLQEYVNTWPWKH